MASATRSADKRFVPNALMFSQLPTEAQKVRASQPGVSEALEFTETLACASTELTHYRRRRALILYFGLDGEEPWTLQSIAEAFGVSREAVRQARDNAASDLVYQAMIDTSGRCATLVGQARRLAQQFEHDLVSLLDAFEGGSGTTRARDWVLLVLQLAGRPRQNATKLGDEACRRQRAALLAVEVERRTTARGNRATERRAAALTLLLDRALWPSTARADWQLTEFSAQRNVRGGIGQAGSFHSQKLGRRVQYESGLELAFLTLLERAEAVAGYQEQPLTIDYVVDGRPSTYVPDVVVHFDDGRVLVVEIKPQMQMALTTNIRKWTALARWCGRQGAGLLVWDGRVSVTEVLTEPCDTVYCGRLLEVLRKGSLNYPEYRRGVGRDRPVNDLAAAVGAGLVAWQLAPFLLRLPTLQEARDALAFTRLLRGHGDAMRSIG